MFKRCMLLITFLVVAMLLSGLWLMAYTGYRSATWPTTSGQVVGVEKHPGLRYQPPTQAWVYEYTVGATTYRQTRATYHIWPSGEIWYDRLQIGEPVTVFYDPAAPGEATLQRGFHTKDALILFICTAGLVIPLLWEWHKMRLTSRRRGQALR